MYSKFLNKSYHSSAIMKATSICIACYSRCTSAHAYYILYSNVERLKCQTNLACARDHSPKTHKSHHFPAFHTQYILQRFYFSVCVPTVCQFCCFVCWYNGTEKALAVIDSLSGKLNLSSTGITVN